MECKDCKYARIKNAYNSSGKVGTIIVCHITNKKKKEGDSCKRFRQNDKFGA